MENGCIKHYNACVKKRIDIMRFQILNVCVNGFLDQFI